MKKAIITITAAVLLAASAVTVICVSRNSTMDTILASNVEALTYGESLTDTVWDVKDQGGGAYTCVYGGHKACEKPS